MELLPKRPNDRARPPDPEGDMPCSLDGEAWHSAAVAFNEASAADLSKDIWRHGAPGCGKLESNCVSDGESCTCLPVDNEERQSANRSANEARRGGELADACVATMLEADLESADGNG